MYEPQFTAGPYGLAAPSGGIPRWAFGVVAAIALMALVFILANTAGSCSQGAVEGDSASHPAVFKVTWEPDVAYALNPNDMLSLPNTDKVEGASLNASAPQFSIGSGALASINADIASIEKSAPCGFVFENVATGRAIAYHAGNVMYIASASKEPLVYYATTHPASEDGLSEEERYEAEGAIEWSDNDLFFSLCNTYFFDGYLNWLASYGIEHAAGRSDYFPTMSPEQLGAIWAETEQYLQGGSDDAQWLAGLFGATEESYIRDGLTGTGATVLDKAGWMAGSDADSVSDAGIVQSDGSTYLMIIVTEQPEYDSGSRQRVSQLARDLYDVRGFLAPHIAIEV